MKNPALIRHGLAVVLLLINLPLQADQNDPRLDRLFEILRETNSTPVLAEVESQIWTIWYQHPENDAQALLVAGDRLMNSGYYREALQVFSSLIDRHPGFAEAWNRRATLHYLAGNLDRSIEDVQKTLELEPRHFGALSGLGLVYLRQDNLIGARDAFEQLLDIHPNSPAARQNLERVLQSLRNRFI